MRGTDDIRAWVITGALGSMALGVALIPLRSMVAASNLAFVFLAFTIVVAELGGRGPALVTALVSAMSLDFFLTEPYLNLAINKTDDVVAFFALAVCGLIAAAFGSRRERLLEAASRADRELLNLTRFIGRARSGRAPADGQGRLLAAAPDTAGVLSPPPLALTPDTLFATGDEAVRFGSKGMRLPEGGGRLTLQTARGPVTLDVWEGNEEGFTSDESRTLAIATSILALGMR
jgi:hypothetical protein